MLSLSSPTLQNFHAYLAAFKEGYGKILGTKMILKDCLWAAIHLVTTEEDSRQIAYAVVSFDADANETIPALTKQFETHDGAIAFIRDGHCEAAVHEYFQNFTYS